MSTRTHFARRVTQAWGAGGFPWRRFVVPVFALFALTTFLPAPASAAVTISSFTAQAKAPQIQVNWKTATEINNAGFNLLRSTTQTGTYTKIAGLIPAKNPGSILGSSYAYSDAAVTGGQTYYYKLQSVESSGGTQQFGPVSAALPAQATATPPPPTATRAPTQAPTSTSVPLATSTVKPGPTSTPLPNVVASPARAPRASQPVASSTPETVDSPSPTPALVAIGIKQSTPEPDALDVESDAQSAADASADRVYYADRLVLSGIILSTFLLLMGTFVLGTMAVYYYLSTRSR